MIKNKFLIGQKVIVIAGLTPSEQFITGIFPHKDGVQYSVGEKPEADYKPFSIIELILDMKKSLLGPSDKMLEKVRRNEAPLYKESEIYLDKNDFLARISFKSAPAEQTDRQTDRQTA